MSVPNEAFQIVNQSDGPPPSTWTKAFAYDASGNMEYQGWTRSNQESEWSVGALALTSIVVAANVATATFVAAHGLLVGHQLEVLNSLDDDLNVASMVATVADSTHITFATVNVANGTYNNVSLAIRSKAPRKNAPIWVIQKFFYDASSFMTDSRWAQGNNRTLELIWDNRTTYDYR